MSINVLPEPKFKICECCNSYKFNGKVYDISDIRKKTERIKDNSYIPFTDEKNRALIMETFSDVRDTTTLEQKFSSIENVLYESGWLTNKLRMSWGFSRW